MIIPVVAYGDPVLRKKCEDITKEYDKLNDLLKNMWETMYNANGVGLAAPQIGLPIRIFLIDTTQMLDKGDKLKKQYSVKKGETGIKKTFINAKITKRIGAEWPYNEGCLSIPTVREDVVRQVGIEIEYFDENFKKLKETYDGLASRVIQHEYDHIEGILFTDHLKPLKKTLLKKKLEKVSKGRVDVDYRMKFPKK